MMSWCPCWPSKRPKPVISAPMPSGLRPLSLVPGPPRAAPAAPGSHTLPDDVVPTAARTRSTLISWLYGQMSHDDMQMQAVLQRPKRSASDATEWLNQQMQADRATLRDVQRRISEATSEPDHGPAFEPQSPVSGIIVHLGDRASELSGESTYSSEHSN